MLEHDNLGEWLQSFVDLNSIDVWFLRTEGGKLFQEYLSNNYISLGWNYYNSKTLTKGAATNNKQLVKQIQDMYQIKTGQRILNQVHNFIYGMKSGDLVLLPDISGRVYALVMLKEYYEEDVSFSIEEEKALMEDLKSATSGQEIINPYKKRWRIVILGKIESQFLPPSVRIVLRNFGALMNLSKYKEDALCAFFPFFQYKNAFYINLKVNSPEVTAKVFSKLTGNINKYFELTTGIDSSKITTQSNINSPGIIQTIIDFTTLLKDQVPEIFKHAFWVFFFITGGKIAGFEFPGVLGAALRFNRERAEVDGIRANSEKTRAETDLLKNQLKANFPASMAQSTQAVENLRHQASVLGYTLVANDVESVSEEIVEAANQLREKAMGKENSE